MELFEIVVILLFFLLPVLEGIFKHRRKQRGEGGSPGAAGGPDAGAESGGSGDVLPDELWEELTGAPAPGSASSSEPESLDFEAPEAAGDGPGGSRVHEWGEPAGGSEVAEGEWISAPPGSEGAAGEPGVEEAEAVPVEPGEPDRAAAEREALRRELAAGRRRPGTGRSRAGELQRVRPGRLARRGAASTEGAHPLLGETDAEALRRAVVWREVLGRPLALRRRGGKEDRSA